MESAVECLSMGPIETENNVYVTIVNLMGQ